MHPMQMADATFGALASTGSHFLAPFAQAAAPMAVAAVWQGAAIAAVLALCLRFAPRVTAAHRFAVWAAGFVVAFGLPFLPLIAQAAGMGNEGISRTPVAATTSWIQIDSRWGFAIVALWLAASATRAASLVYHSVRLRQLWKTAKPVKEHMVVAPFGAMSPAKRRIEICTTQWLDRPSVIGFFAPRILIPDWLFARLTAAELEQVVLHESEHLLRRDDWFNLLQKVALVLFPLNPALAWMEGRLCREREMACDEGVVRRTQAPREYAACLASLAERGLQRRELLRRAEALSLGAWQRRPELVRRVHSILKRKQALHPLAARTLVGVVGCGLVMASVELARCPQVIAFVPAAKPVAQSIALAHNESGAAAPTPARDADDVRGASGFRAVEAKAILPAAIPAAGDAAPVPVSMHRSARQLADAQEQEIAFHEAHSEAHSNAAHEVLLKAQSPSIAANSADEPQFIVLTAWEETRTRTRHAREIADYDTGPTTPQQVDEASAEPGSEPATRITITRLILAVYPASPVSAPADGSQEVPSSKSGQQTAPLADGAWLVFQL